jgi:hypothetical protein
MGLRFYRRFKIAPGLSINLSKSGVSATVGERGAHLTVGTRGATASAGIPGTGLSWREQRRWKKSAAAPSPPAAPLTPDNAGWWFNALGWLLIFLFVCWLFH